MAKADVVELDTPTVNEPKLNLVPDKLRELTLPKFDLDALISVQTAKSGRRPEAGSRAGDPAHPGRRYRVEGAYRLTSELAYPSAPSPPWEHRPC
jgi:hypothetical protein